MEADLPNPLGRVKLSILGFSAGFFRKTTQNAPNHPTRTIQFSPRPWKFQRYIPHGHWGLQKSLETARGWPAPRTTPVRSGWWVPHFWFSLREKPWGSEAPFNMKANLDIFKHHAPRKLLQLLAAGSSSPSSSESPNASGPQHTTESVNRLKEGTLLQETPNIGFPRHCPFKQLSKSEFWQYLRSTYPHKNRYSKSKRSFKVRSQTHHHFNIAMAQNGPPGYLQPHWWLGTPGFTSKMRKMAILG